MNDPMSKRSFIDFTNLSPELYYTSLRHANKIRHESSNCEKINAISCFTQILFLLLLGVTQAKQMFKRLLAAQNNHGSESKSCVLRRISRNCGRLGRSVVCWERSERATDKLETTV